MSAHIQLSATLGNVSTIKDTTDCQSNATSSETNEDLDTSENSESDDCVLQEVGSQDTSDEDNIPLEKRTSNSWSNSDFHVLYP